VLSYLIWRGTTGRALVAGVTASAALVLFAVLMMRWNVVIGGQEIGKTGKGLVNYLPTIGGREGLLAAASLVAMPFVLLWAAVKLFPPWQRSEIPSPAGHSPFAS
jgi:predicted membrane protein